MKGVFSLLFALFVAILALTAAFPQSGVNSGSELRNLEGKVLLHTSGIEKGHKHTAECFGFNNGGGGAQATTAATTTTAAASRK